MQSTAPLPVPTSPHLAAVPRMGVPEQSPDSPRSSVPDRLGTAGSTLLPLPVSRCCHILASGSWTHSLAQAPDTGARRQRQKEKQSGRGRALSNFPPRGWCSRNKRRFAELRAKPATCCAPLTGKAGTWECGWLVPKETAAVAPFSPEPTGA